jgi:cytochrome c5
MKHIGFVSLLMAALSGVAMAADSAEMTGKEAFDHYCTYCHGADDGPGTMQLKRTRGKDLARLTERTNLSADYVQYVVRHGLRAMPPFVPSDLTDAQLKALAAFLAK